MIVLQSSVFGPMEMRQCGERSAACPYRTRPAGAIAPGDAWVRCLSIDEDGAAADRLLAAVTHTDDMVLLRQVVAGEGRPVAWLSNSQVVDHVARRVARRDLCLLVMERPASGSSMSGRLQVQMAPERAATPSMLRSRPEDDLRQTAAVVADFTDDMDQALQAGVLVEAARDGVPFCEVCAKARQGQSGSAGAA